MAVWRSTILNEFQPDSPNEKWGAGASSITRTFRLPDGSFRSRMQAAYDILGYTVLSEASENSFIQRIVPMPYPASLIVVGPADEPDVGNIPSLFQAMWAIGISRTEQLGVASVNLDPVGGVLAADYSNAAINVEFSTLPYQIRPDYQVDSIFFTNGGPDEGKMLAAGWINSRYIMRHIDPFSRLIKVPYGMMWNVGIPGGLAGSPSLPKNTKTALPTREGGANVSYTWMRVPLTPSPGGVPWGTISGALGTVNLNAFDFAQPQTLLLDNVATREYQGAFGERYADVTFNMIYLPHPSSGALYAATEGAAGKKQGTPMGWNYILDSIKYNGVQILDYFYVQSGQTTGFPPFAVSDFSTLFHPGP